MAQNRKSRRSSREKSLKKWPQPRKFDLDLGMTRHPRILTESELDHLLAYQVTPLDPRAVGGWAESTISTLSVARILTNLSKGADVTARLADSPSRSKM